MICKRIVGCLVIDFYGMLPSLAPHFVLRLGSGPNNMLAFCSSGIFHILWYNPVSLKKDKTSSMLTFSNKPQKVFTLKNRFLGRAKALLSRITCLTASYVCREVAIPV